MCGIYCVYKQSRSCQLPFCASPIFHFEIGDFSVYLYIYIYIERGRVEYDRWGSLTLAPIIQLRSLILVLSQCGHKPGCH